MLSQLIIITLCLKQIFSLSCQPFGLRLSFGKTYAQTSSTNPERLSIYFNTKDQCSKSFVQYQSQGSSFKVYCMETEISTSNMANYKTFVYRCSITELAYSVKFTYMGYGWTGKVSDAPIPASNNLIEASLINPQNKISKVNFIVLADWSALQQKAKVYTPLDEAFIFAGQNYAINGLIVNGDIAYDLDSNEGKNYESYLKMLSKYCSTFPVIHLTGNHEYNSNDDWALFTKSFDLYDLDSKLATSLRLGPFSYVMSDPHEILYAKNNLRNHGSSQSLSQLTKTLELANKNNNIVIAGSHYPLACSGTANFCVNNRKTLKNYFTTMIDHKVALYIGAHYHVYDRIYPYYKDGHIDTQMKAPYLFNQNQPYLISVVEGIPGNNDKIVQDQNSIASFSASLSFNSTGFGILTVTQETARYTHISAKGGPIITDTFEIIRKIKASEIEVLE